MRKKVNMDKIAEVNINLKKELDKIEQIQKKLNEDIEKLNECYKGQDAELIKAKYKGNVKSIDALTTTLDSYTKYFKWLTDSYEDNLNSTMKNYNPINESMNLIDEKKNSKEISSFTLDTIYSNDDYNDNLNEFKSEL